MRIIKNNYQFQETSVEEGEELSQIIANVQETTMEEGEELSEITTNVFSKPLWRKEKNYQK